MQNSSSIYNPGVSVRPYKSAGRDFGSASGNFYGTCQENVKVGLMGV